MIIVKYITTREFNKLSGENFATRLAQAKLATKVDVVDFIKKNKFDDKLKKLNEKVTSNKTKHVEAEKKITNLTNKNKQTSEKGYDLECILQAMMIIRIFLFLRQCLVP